MEHSDFLSMRQLTQDQNIYNVGVYPDVIDNNFELHTPVESALEAGHNEDLLRSNLRLSGNILESQANDLLNVKNEGGDGENNKSATDDESMAVEALRQLGNSSYTQNKFSDIQTTIVNDLPLLSCTNCQMEFRTNTDLLDHSKICTNRQFTCRICNETFIRKLDLNNHLLCHIEQPFSCRMCNAFFIQKSDLHQHMLTHGMEHQCQICGQQFSRPSSLTNHMKIHNYQPGRALLSTKIEGTSELADILTGDADPEIQPMQKILLPSINNLSAMNNWNLCYDTDSFNLEDINTSLDEKIINSNSRIIESDERMEAESRVMENVYNKDKPYECTRCMKTFAREKALQNHIKLHQAVLDNFHICERCDQNFHNPTSLDRHLNFCGVKTKPRDLKPTFPKVQKKKEVIKEKQSDIIPSDSNFDVPKIYKHRCSECCKGFTTKQKLFRHMWIHRKRMFTCELCTKTFEQQELLDAHRLSMHQAESPYACSECGKNFASRQGLWEHNRLHTPDTSSFKCDECNKSFTSRQGYLIHKRKHTDERPYGCRFCWKAFRDGGTLRKHERIHTGERPHACPLCAKAFNQKVVLREHVRWLHTANLPANQEGQFTCTVCSLKVTDKDELCAHIVRHSDQIGRLARTTSQTTNENKNTELSVSKFISNENVIIEHPGSEIEASKYLSEEIEEAIYIQKVDNNQHEQFISLEDEFLLPEQKILENRNQMQCDLCGNTFKNKVELSDHIRIHI